jgi:PST family polysaccharide transporter
MTLGALASLVNVAASIARNKALALTVGPEGIGILGEASQVASFAVALAALATGPVLGGAVAGASRDNVPERARAAIATSLVLGCGLGITGAALAIVAAPAVVGSSWPVSTRTAIALAVAASIVGQVAATLSTGMAALEDTYGTTVAALLSSFIGSAITVWMSVAFGLPGALWSLPASAAVTLAATAAFAWRARRWRALLLPDGGLSGPYAWLSISIGAAGLLGSIAQQTSLVGIRATLEHVGGSQGGALLNGQFQAAFGLEAQFFAFTMTGLFTYYWPQFGIARSAEETSVLLDRVTSFILKTFPPVALAGVLARRELIALLFSDRFRVATDLLAWYLAASTPKALLYAYGAPLYFAGKPVRFAAMGALGFGFLGLLSIGLALRFGIIGVAVGQFVGVIVHLAMAMALTRFTIGARLRAHRALVALALAAGLLAIDAIAAERRIVRWTLLALTLAWIGVNALKRIRRRSPAS